MKKTYKFSLPQSKEVEKTNIRVENGEILVDVEFKDKFEPKDGDFVVSSYRCVFIYSSNIASDEYTYSSYCGEYAGGCGISTTFSNNWTKREGCRYATEAEKSAFLNRLEKEYHKRWNTKTKTLEDIYIPKFGDIVRIGTPNKIFKRDYIISIFPNKDIPKNNVSGFFNIAGVNLNGDVWIGGFGGYYNSADIREATESEKQELFDKLAKVGKRWNAETKTLEDIRWMPNLNEKYYFIDSRLHIAFAYYTSSFSEKDMINIGNCFHTLEATQKVADQIKEIFKNSKAE